MLNILKAIVIIFAGFIFAAEFDLIEYKSPKLITIHNVVVTASYRLIKVGERFIRDIQEDLKKSDAVQKEDK